MKIHQDTACKGFTNDCPFTYVCKFGDRFAAASETGKCKFLGF